jgi:hypothetical protein
VHIEHMDRMLLTTVIMVVAAFVGFYCIKRAVEGGFERLDRIWMLAGALSMLVVPLAWYLFFHM